jgi:hypothetical protein
MIQFNIKKLCVQFSFGKAAIPSATKTLTISFCVDQIKANRVYGFHRAFEIPLFFMA